MTRHILVEPWSRWQEVQVAPQHETRLNELYMAATFAVEADFLTSSPAAHGAALHERVPRVCHERGSNGGSNARGRRGTPPGEIERRAAVSRTK
ncbi:MAG: hypothetical protein M3253_06255 [Chloroflexota bacterium]|nr:hypothetical protein [Chloroflexota bacterium]